MDPTIEAGGVQPQPTDERPWAGRGFRMEVVAERGVPGGEAGGEGGGGNAQEGGSLEGLYDLSSVPEELRGYVENVAKQIQGNVTRSFQDHADFRKTWEPFSQVDGLTEVPPEELTELVQFREIASDPAKFDDWLVQVASAMAEADPGRFEAVFGRLGQETGLLDPDDDGESGEDGGAFDQEAMREMFTELLDERLGPIEQHVNTSSQEARVQAAQAHIASEIEAVQQLHKDQFGEDEELDEDAIAHIKALAFAHDGAEDAIRKAYAQHLKVTGQAQGELIDEKLGQPRPGVNGGRADTAPETFSAQDPALKAAALQRLRAG
jgi:hypothetical protein